MTFAVDWALRINCRSIFFTSSKTKTAAKRRYHYALIINIPFPELKSPFRSTSGTPFPEKLADL